MIVGERKPFEEIKALLKPYRRILLVGCGTCVSVCMAGGEKEVELLASELRMASRLTGDEKQFDEITVQRQCDEEYLRPLAEKIKQYDAALSLACGAGVQFLAEKMEPAVVLPALNTRFIGVTVKEGVWSERCRACAECVLAETGGICPVTICAKGLLNGPCGGTSHGKCEVDQEKDCAWTIIYRRLEKQGRLDNIRRIFPPKNHQTATHPATQTHAAYKGVKDAENV